jgi:hypothetical protein
MPIFKKLFRVADHALVVYSGTKIIGVKHREVSAWLVWDRERLDWLKAPRDEAAEFERLPLTGHLNN